MRHLQKVEFLSQVPQFIMFFYYASFDVELKYRFIC